MQRFGIYWESYHSVHIKTWCNSYKNLNLILGKAALENNINIALANKDRDVPEYLQVDEKNKKVKFVRTPKFEEVPYPVVMEPNLVIEYYSR